MVTPPPVRHPGRISLLWEGDQLGGGGARHLKPGCPSSGGNSGKRRPKFPPVPKLDVWLLVHPDDRDTPAVWSTYYYTTVLQMSRLRQDTDRCSEERRLPGLHVNTSMLGLRLKIEPSAAGACLGLPQTWEIGPKWGGGPHPKSGRSGQGHFFGRLGDAHPGPWKGGGALPTHQLGFPRLLISLEPGG